MKRYYITDRRSVGGFHPLLEIIRDQMHIGVDFIQIREKDIEARELFEFASAVINARENHSHVALATKVLVNTRSDVARAAGCDGVHLPAAAPRECLPGLLVARSCHSLAEIQECTADLMTFGPIFSSPGKGSPIGLLTLGAACRFCKPVFALGGVTWDNAVVCVEAGAVGIAGIRLFQNPQL
jgi:thiamine-phosphate pyrophosphorylase